METVLLLSIIYKNPWILVIFVVLIIIIAIQAATSDRQSTKKTESYTKPSSPTTNFVSSKDDFWTVTIPYDGAKRYIDGRPIATPDDMTEWWVLKDFSEAIGSHLRALENAMLNGECSDFTDAKNQWDKYYARLRELCIRHKLWNPALKDRKIFVPTSMQLFLEKQLFERIETACEIGVSESYQYKEKSTEIFDYILSQPGHAAVRRQMVSELAGNDPDVKDEYRNVCRRMVKDGILSETHDEEGHLLLKKRRPRRKKAEEEPELAPSSFSSTLYKNIDHRMLCKVKHTVGRPESLDRTGNRCKFQSLSSGEIYSTSLRECTCQAFENGSIPCKHMVALAKHLGYI